MALTLTKRFSLARFTRGEAAAKHDITLDHRRIFILPNKAGFALAMVIILMLIASINYNNSMGFLFTFLLAASAQISTFYSYRNLSGLNVHAGKSEPCFLGERGHYNLYIKELDGREHWAISIKVAGFIHVLPHLKPYESLCFPLTINPTHRGWFSVGTITLFCSFPFDVFRAWSPLQFEQKVLVYPAPLATNSTLPVVHSDKAEGRTLSQQAGADEFIGFRRYQKGDHYRHINWKAVAAQKGTYINQFSAEQASEISLDWAACTEIHPELRLSELCRWVIDAEACGLRYRLKLPDITLEPEQGSAHRHQCLKALAIYDA